MLKRTKSQQDFSVDAEGNPVEGSDVDPNANNNAVATTNGGTESAPAIPPHADSVNGNGPAAKEPTEEDLNDLQDFLDSGNLDHLDNMVNEFAKQYMPDQEGGESGPQANNNVAKS